MAGRALFVCPDARQFKCYDHNKDFELMYEILEPLHFDIIELCGTVLREDIREQLRKLIKGGADVIVLLFCGHGCSDSHTPDHGMMKLSKNEKLTDAYLKDCLRPFKGTFIGFFNACGMGAPVPTASTMYASPIGQGLHDNTVMPTISPQCAFITIAATSAFETQKGGSSGTAFISNIHTILSGDPGPAYDTFGELYAAKYGKELEYPTGSVYEGAFFSLAKAKGSDAPVVRYVECFTRYDSHPSPYLHAEFL
jgi:hypothetical protein